MTTMTSNPQSVVSLSGYVRHQGMPVQGVEVNLYPQTKCDDYNASTEPLATVRTTMKGQFSFKIEPGQYCLEAIPDDQGRFLKTRVADLKVPSINSVSVNLNTGVILRGRVITKGGDQLKTARVHAFGIEPSSYWASSLLDKDGVYALVLPRGKFHMLAVDTAEIDLENQFQFRFLSKKIHVVEVEQDQEFDFSLGQIFKFDGRVLDATINPVAHGKIQIRANTEMEKKVFPIAKQELELLTKINADKDGKFQIFLDKGAFDFIIDPPPGSKYFGVEQKGVAVEESAAHSFNLVEGKKVEGNISFEGNSLSDCLIRLQEVSNGREYLVKSDSSGKFSLYLPSGKYQLAVTAHPKDSPSVTIDGDVHSSIAPWTEIIKVEDECNVQVNLSRGRALKGQVKDDTGQPRPGVKISVHTDLKRALCEAMTDSAGKFCIFLAPATYQIVAQDDKANAITVRVEEKSEVCDLELTWHGWCQARFKVQSEDGANIPRCQIKYMPYGYKDEADASLGPQDPSPSDLSYMPLGYVLTNEEGIGQITVPAGIYSVFFHPPEAGSYLPKQLRQISISGDMERKVALSRK